MELIFDRTQSDVEKKTEKGYYNASDLNRVILAMRELSALFAAEGYPASILSTDKWNEELIPTVPEMETYLADLQKLKSLIKSADEQKNVGVTEIAKTNSGSVAGNGGVQLVPKSMNKLTYITANDIERVLYQINQAFERLKKSVVPCGAASSGEDYL